MTDKNPKPESDIIKTVDNFFSIAKEGTAQERRSWVSRYKYWKSTEKIKRPSFKDNIRIPMIFMISDGIQSVLTDNKPKMLFFPQEENDVATADYLQQIIGDYYWDVLGLSRVSEEVMWWALNISGSGLAGWGIDKATDKFYVKALNSFACYPDPGATSLESCEFFIYASPMPLTDLKRSYDRGKEVPADETLTTALFNDEEIVSPWGRASGKSENLIGVYKDEAFKREYGKAILVKCWMRDDSVENIPFNVSETNKEHSDFASGQMMSPNVSDSHPKHIEAHKEFVSAHAHDDNYPLSALEGLLKHIADHQEYPDEMTRLKYSQGRLVDYANNIELDDRPAPLGLQVAKMDYIIDPRSFWGNTLQERLQTLQDSMVRRKRQMSDAFDLIGNPREIYNVYSGYDPDKVRNTAGEQVPVRGDPRAAIYRDSGGTPPPFMLEDSIDSERLTEKIAGWQEVQQGKYPRGAPSGVSIEQLLEASGPRLRKGSRHFEEFLIKVARGIISMLPYEDPKKIYAILGEGKEKPIYISLDELKTGGEFDIRIIAGSTMPSSRMAKEDRAMKLVQAGIYDPEDALTFLDDPMKNKIMERKSIVAQQQQLINALMEQNKLLKENSGNVPIQERLEQRESQAGRRREAAGGDLGYEAGRTGG